MWIEGRHFLNTHRLKVSVLFHSGAIIMKYNWYQLSGSPVHNCSFAGNTMACDTVARFVLYFFALLAMVDLRAIVLKFEVCIRISLLKHRLLGPNPRVSDLVGLGWGLRVCISERSQVMLVLLVQECTWRITNLGVSITELSQYYSSDSPIFPQTFSCLLGAVNTGGGLTLILEKRRTQVWGGKSDIL